MASHDKEPIVKIFCLLHQKIDCQCIASVVDDKTLKMRLMHQIRLNNILITRESDETAKGKRDEQTILYETRLADLKDLI